jgi:hypothetical protein
VTDDKSQKHEFTVWNAPDMKKFPMKLATSERGNSATLLFKKVTLSKPDAALFDPPADYKKYNSAQELMMDQMKQRMGGMNMQAPGRP